MTISFQYKDEEPLVFSSPASALSYFTSKGYGMWHYMISADGAPISLEQFNELLDQERASV